jgi:hypothetical protein
VKKSIIVVMDAVVAMEKDVIVIVIVMINFIKNEIRTV